MYPDSKENCKLIRKKILDISQKVSALHVGGAFSSVELIEKIFFKLKEKNDTFILSKGHAGILLYSVLNILGKIKNQELDLYCKSKGDLGVHPDYNNYGISASTGSLGHGLGLAAGMAIAEINTTKKIFVLISDGELQEGSIWETILFISSRRLNNIILLVDNNNLQSSTKTTDTHPTLYPIDKKFTSFGWNVANCNGHNSLEIEKNLNLNSKKPFALVARTIKGYPISFMKNDPKWHYRSPDLKEFKKAMDEIKKN